MNKNDLTSALADKTGLTKGQCSQILTALPDVLADFLSSDGEFRLPGVCRAKVVDIKERKARNPRTGGTIILAARRGISVKPAKVLVDHVRGDAPLPADDAQDEA